ncbi:MAG: hypothetical protein WCT14_06975, partial [Treponemataceae bacterium]
MFSKRNVVKLVVAIIAFAAADYWIWSSLRDAFRNLTEESRFKEIALFARTAPQDAAQAAAWLATLDGVLPGARGAYFTASADGSSFVLAAADDAGRKLWEERKAETDFVKGLESAYYLEPFVSAKQWEADFGAPLGAASDAAKGPAAATGGNASMGKAKARVYFAPVP